MQRLGDVRRGDRFAARQVSDGAGELEDTVEGARRELEPLGSGAQNRLGGGIYLAVGAHLGWPYLRVAGDGRTRESFRLHRPRGVHPRTHRRRALALLPIGQLLVLDTRDFDVDIDAVQQRTGEACLVAGGGGGRAGTLAYRVSRVAAGAPMQLAIVKFGPTAC